MRYNYIESWLESIARIAIEGKDHAHYKQPIKIQDTVDLIKSQLGCIDKELYRHWSNENNT